MARKRAQLNRVPFTESAINLLKTGDPIVCWFLGEWLEHFLKNHHPSEIKTMSGFGELKIRFDQWVEGLLFEEDKLIGFEYPWTASEDGYLHIKETKVKINRHSFAPEMFVRSENPPPHIFYYDATEVSEVIRHDNEIMLKYVIDGSHEMQYHLTLKGNGFIIEREMKTPDSFLYNRRLSSIPVHPRQPEFTDTKVTG